MADTFLTEAELKEIRHVIVCLDELRLGVSNKFRSLSAILPMVSPFDSYNSMSYDAGDQLSFRYPMPRQS